MGGWPPGARREEGSMPGKACAIWVNYNSMRFISLALESLDSIASQDYADVEVIVVDNGSSDGSIDVIEERLASTTRPHRVIRLGRNTGFANAVNEGFEAAVREGCSYVVLVNNDAVLEPHAFTEMLEYLEQHPRVGGVSGVLVNPATGRVDAAGGVLIDNGLFAGRWTGGDPAAIPRHPVHISFVDGALAALRVEAVRRAGYRGKPFIPDTFAYCDDNLLSFAMWSSGYSSVALPRILGRHARSTTFGRRATLGLYLSYRCIAMHAHGYMPLPTRLYLQALTAKRALIMPIARRDPHLATLIIRAWRDGKKLAKKHREYLSRIKWEAIPKYRLTTAEKLAALIAYNRIRYDWSRYDNQHRAPD